VWASNPSRAIEIHGTEMDRGRLLTGERSSPVRDVQEAVDGGAPVGCDGGEVADEVRMRAASSCVRTAASNSSGGEAGG
jgi:hypothetical protein